MEMLAAAGINSFKFFMAYKGAFQVSDEQMLAGFRKCKELGAIAQVRQLWTMWLCTVAMSLRDLQHNGSSNPTCGRSLAGARREW